MTCIIGKTVRTNTDVIESWQTDIILRTRRYLSIIAHGSTNKIFSYGTEISVDCTAPDVVLTSIGIDAIHYVLAEAERGNRSCHVREMLALFNDMVELMKPSAVDGSFEDVASFILNSECDAVITIPGFDAPLNRVEAVMALQTLNPDIPIEIHLRTYLPQSYEKLTYSVASSKEA